MISILRKVMVVSLSHIDLKRYVLIKWCITDTEH